MEAKMCFPAHPIAKYSESIKGAGTAKNSGQGMRALEFQYGAYHYPRCVLREVTWSSFSQARTVPVALALFSGASQHEVPYGLIMAASVLVTLPLIVLVVIFQRRIISGLTAGSVKG